MESRTRASLWWIILSDYLAQLAVLFPLVMWGIYVAAAVIGLPALKPGRPPLTAEDSPQLLYMAVIFTIVGIPALIWRFRRFQSLFDCGQEVEGRVVRVWFYRGRGRVEFEYAYQDRLFKRSQAIASNRRTRRLRTETEVTVVVDPSNPGRAAIRQLYV